jgi:hypothetical protein
MTDASRYLDVDRYAQARAKLRSASRETAMGRLWEMAREGMSVRAVMGVRELTYQTDLLPGVTLATLTADRTGVTLDLEGVEWQDIGEEAHPASLTYRLDEAWLLGGTS